MNNDISDVKNFLKTMMQKQRYNFAEVSANQISEDIVDSNEIKVSPASSIECLGAFGCAQVKMNNPLMKGVKASVDSYIKDSDFAKEHVDLCDKLVQKGYPLEYAIYTTDKFFETLKNKDTYR